MSMFAASIIDQLSSVVPEDFLDWKWHYLTLANESGIQNIAFRLSSSIRRSIVREKCKFLVFV